MFVVYIVMILLIAVMIPLIPSLAMDMMAVMLVDRPEDVEGWYSYGRLLQWKGYDVAALAAYRSAVLLNPLRKDVWKRMGDLLTKLGDYEGADEAYGLSV
jgi:cytochrome c-type biogenesis protein CcmH/NrfG